MLKFRSFYLPLFILFVFLFGQLFCSNLSAYTVTLSWNPPTTNADGTQLTDLAGYRIYYYNEQKNFYEVIDVGNITKYEIDNLAINITGTTYRQKVPDTIITEEEKGCLIKVIGYSSSGVPLVEDISDGYFSMITPVN
ncbi:MAG: fibronectin type III domain-containing protein [Thermodesulfovibrionales bacterium]